MQNALEAAIAEKQQIMAAAKGELEEKERELHEAKERELQALHSMMSKQRSQFNKQAEELQKQLQSAQQMAEKLLGEKLLCKQVISDLKLKAGGG